MELEVSDSVAVGLPELSDNRTLEVKCQYITYHTYKICVSSERHMYILVLLCKEVENGYLILFSMSFVASIIVSYKFPGL